MEWWDVYDIDRNKKDKTISSDRPVPDGEYHLVVNVCILNNHNELLIQKRKADKEKWPGLWDVSVGGRARVGENSREAAERELREEIGLELDLTDTLPQLSASFPEGFNDFYLIECDLDLSDLSRQQDEVESLRWASMDEVLVMVGDGNFIPYYPSFIRLIFDMKDTLGVIRTK